MKKNIIIADGHRIFRRNLVRLIQDFADIDVVFEASDSKELMANISYYKDVDVLMLDLHSAEIEGLKNWQIIKRKFPEIHIIILSHLLGDYYLKYAVHTGVLGYFTKDANSNDLLKAVSKSGSGGFYYDEKLQNKVKKIIKKLKDDPSDDIAKFDFSRRELEIIYWSAREFKSKEIGDKLNISSRTVEGHKDKLVKKTHSKSFLGVILIAVELKLISVYDEF